MKKLIGTLAMISFILVSSCTTCVAYNNDPAFKTYLTSQPGKEYKKCIKRAYSPDKTNAAYIIGFLSFISIIHFTQ
jgi:hypothetical protein